LETWMDTGRLVHQEFNWTTVKDKADMLSHKYAPKCTAGVVDYWHVGAAIYFHAEKFLTFDQTQRQLALLAGFDCPNLAAI